jgi:hypothetical protein
LGETYVIWNPRPLFAWQGQVKSLEVRPYSLEHSFDRQPILWQQTLGPEVRQVSYDGPPLQPGQKYDWQIIDAAGIPRRYTFAIMSVSEQQQITHNLKTLLQQLRAASATPTQIASTRAQFFAEQQLWSDAVQEMYNYTVQSNISSAAIPANQDIAQYFCAGH